MSRSIRIFLAFLCAAFLSMHESSAANAAGNDTSGTEEAAVSVSEEAERAGAAAFIGALAEKAIGAITDKEIDLAERQARFRDLLREGLDMGHVAGFVLGPYRRRVDAEQIEAFRHVLEENIVQNYAWRFRNYSGEKFEVLKVEEGRRGREVVATVVQSGDGETATRVDWTVHATDDDYKIIDIEVEGLSMMTTQRDEYVEFLRSHGGKLDALVAALHKQNEQIAAKISE